MVVSNVLSWAQGDNAFQIIDGLRSSNAEARQQVIMNLAKTGDVGMEELLEDYRLGNLYVFDNRMVLGGKVQEDQALNKFVPLYDLRTRAELRDEAGKQRIVSTAELQALSANRKERVLIGKARHLLRLWS